MEDKPKHAVEAADVEPVKQGEKSVLEIGQDVSVLVKATAFRFSIWFWNQIPTKWHKKVKVSAKVCAVIALTVIAFVIGWHSSKSKFSGKDEGDKKLDDDRDINDSNVDLLDGKCSKHQEDPKNCGKYYYCNNGEVQHRNCPMFHHFDQQQQKCLWIHLSSCGKEDDDIDNSDNPPQPTPGDNSVPSLSKVLADEEKITSHGDINILKARLVTLPSEEVELVRPGRAANPPNTKLVETIIAETDWEFLFPTRHPSYSYTNFLKAISKFPAVCYAANPSTCRKVLATMFAHFTQETGAHNPSLRVPEWRQGLAHVEELGCGARDCGYSATCGTTQWTVVAWPCGKEESGKYQSYHGRGAKQLSYNYNYGQFSAAMYGNSRYLLDNPDLVADTWLNLASAVWFFATPQPPKPSMLGVVEGDWEPNQADLSGGLRSGFGLTTNIINGGIECGKGSESQQSINRAEYYRYFANYLGVEVEGELRCGKMKQFSEAGSGSVATYWEQDWVAKYKCKLVSYQTPHSALVDGEYAKCVEEKFKIKLV